MDSKTFLSREDFIKNSNMNNPFIDNIFNVIFEKNKKINDLIVDSLGFINNDTIFQHLARNSYNVTLSNITNTVITNNIANTKHHTLIYKNNSNFQISFVESSDFNIRNIIEQWILLSQTMYYDEVSTDFTYKSLSTTMEETNITYTKVIPLSYADITIDMGKEADMKLTQVEFTYQDDRTEIYNDEFDR